MQPNEQFFQNIHQTLEADSFVRITLSKPYQKSSDLKKIRIKLATIKKQPHLSFIYNHTTKDITKNHSIEAGISEIKTLLGTTFQIASLFSTDADYGLQINKKGKATFHKRPPTFNVAPQRTHDKAKQKLIQTPDYLQELGVLDANGHAKKGKGDKYKQINKFVEIMAGLLRNHATVGEKENIEVVDMGSGKGYLTFALYDFLVNTLKKEAQVTGVEVRPDLIDLCNNIAEKVGFENLKFKKGYIGNFHLPKTDILIALHACDTATDDAIYKGIQAKSELIICAPCCHKQIRKQMNCETHLGSILQYGIHKERMAEMVTDTIRALLLEVNGYQTKVFEFISTDHTGKNVMIVGQRVKEISNQQIPLKKIADLKTEFGITEHYLEKLLKSGER
jgi:SAM-dependent methyltransferase